MGSYFDSLMGRAASTMMRAFGQVVTGYTAANGDLTEELTIYVGGISTESDESQDGSELTIRTRPFCVLKDDQHREFPGLAIVQKRGKFEIDSVSWQVEEIRFENDYEIHGTLTNARERRKTAPKSFRR
jgi:hypothetical protein